LGGVEVDAEGSVNVSTFAGRFAGVGGFLNIAQSTRRVIFCCTLRAGDLRVTATNGRLRIEQEGTHPKFVRRLQQLCFHGPTAFARGQDVLYVTERAVFQLTSAGLSLKEVAPGVDVQRDVLARMEFLPQEDSIKAMPTHCFEDS